MNPTGAKVAANQQNVRASERFDLEVKVDLESDHNFYTGLTQNISAGGVFIATHHIRRIGDRITLKFTLPGSEKTLDVETEVRWIRENTALQRVEGAQGMGVRFINLIPRSVGRHQRLHREPRLALLRRRGLVAARGASRARSPGPLAAARGAGDQSEPCFPLPLARGRGQAA